MTQTVEALSLSLETVLGDALAKSFVRLGELTLVLKPQHYATAMLTLRDHPACRFEQLIDLCGMDYSGYGANGEWDGVRFA
ncbi:MAG: NADH-quinone oxidoreductase subunit C, partial [Thiobacillus sp.]|nr:NADH-quinone oxidoreductase subunit C [Thiobacillus sp.]